MTAAVLCEGASIRPSPRLTTFNGDTHAVAGSERVLLAHVDRGEDAARIAQRRQDAVREPFRVVDQDVYSRASIGIAMYPDDAASPAALLNNANVAMRKNREQDTVAGYSC